MKLEIYILKLASFLKDDSNITKVHKFLLYDTALEFYVGSAKFYISLQGSLFTITKNCNFINNTYSKRTKEVWEFSNTQDLLDILLKLTTLQYEEE